MPSSARRAGRCSRARPTRSPRDHELPTALLRLRPETAGATSDIIGMSFWTDAAVLGGAGIPSVLFGPTGAGLHGLEEWVDVASVLTCRDALASLARQWCRALHELSN